MRTRDRRAFPASASAICSSCRPETPCLRAAPRRGARHAVVVRFSKTRKRYERQGLLVEPQAWREAEREVEAEKG